MLLVVGRKCIFERRLPPNMPPLCVSTELLQILQMVTVNGRRNHMIISSDLMISLHRSHYTVSSSMNFRSGANRSILKERMAFIFKRSCCVFFFFFFSTIGTLKTTTQSKNVPMAITQSGLYEFYSNDVVLVCCFKHFSCLYLFFPVFLPHIFHSSPSLHCLR